MKNNRDGIKRKETRLGWCGTQCVIDPRLTKPIIIFILIVYIYGHDTIQYRYDTGMSIRE